MATTYSSGSMYEPRARGAAVLAVAFWTALLVMAAQFPDSRIWALNHLAFLPDGFHWGLLTIGFLTILYILFARTNTTRLSSAWLHRWPGALVLIAVVVGMGWLMRARTPLLGDGILRGADALSTEAPLGSEWLASALAQAMMRVGLFSGDTGGYSALSLISLVFAGVLAIGLWYYAPRAGVTRPWAFVFWILTFGSMRLLAGYVESYAPAFALLVLWGVASVGFMRGRLSPWHAIVLCCLAILSHAAALGIVPATLWILWRGHRAGRAGTATLIAFPAVVIAVTVFMAWEINRQQVGGIGVEAGHFLMPLVATTGHPYGILSPAHLIDFLNQWILLAPAAIVAGLLVLFTGKRQAVAPPDNRVADSGPRDTRIFWILAITPMLLGSLIIDPKLGWARDWDLMTIFATPALVALALWLTRLTNASVCRASGSVALMSLALWLAIGARAESEEQRYEALLELDPSRAAYGHEIMAIYYRYNDKRLGEIKHYTAALEYSDNLRYRANIANAYYNLNRVDDAIAWYQSIYERDSTYYLARYSLALALMRVGRYDDALPHAEWALANAPDDPECAFILGSILLYLQRPEDALPHLETAARAMPNDAAYLNILGGCYQRLGRKREAGTAWRQAIKANPSDPSPYVNLAAVEFDLGHYSDARQLLDQYATLVSPAQWTSTTRALYDTLLKASP